MKAHTSKRNKEIVEMLETPTKLQGCRKLKTSNGKGMMVRALREGFASVN